MKRLALFVVSLAVLLTVGFYLSTLQLTAQEEEPQPNFVPGQVIVRFKEDVTREQISDFYAEYGLSEKDNLDPDPSDADQGMRLAAAPVDVDENLLEMLESDPRVLYAEPNYILQISDWQSGPDPAQTIARLLATPNDPMFDQLWGLHNTGQTGGTNDADIDAPEAWDVSTGSDDVIIAVIDTGVDYTHEDLQANMWTNPKECPQGPGKCQADGKDDDNNGYVDDFYGINAINDSGDVMDDFGHGTHVAGTIAAVGNNRKGVVGVSWKSRIVGCKFLSAFGSGTTANAVKCFNYIYDLKTKQKQNILLTNNSWGGGGRSRSLEEAMGRVDSPLHIASAGNSNTNRLSYPAGYDLENIISVAATDQDDKYASFSNYGEDWVDLAAPGVSILSTVPTGRCAICDPSGYRAINGTSMAAPHVAGAAALVWSEFGNLNNAQVKQRVLSGSDPLKDRSKLTLTNARLNLFNVMEKDSTPPAPVTDLSPTGILLTKVILSWTATGDDGFSGVATSYDVRYSQTPISAATWEQATPVEDVPEPGPSGTRETVEVSGLEPNTTYYFALRAADNVGNVSDLSNIVIARTSAGTIVFEDDMESGAGKWTVDDSKDNLWHLSNLRFNSPETAWYYGQEKERNYDTGKANEGTITSVPIDIAGADDALLTFYEWSEVQRNRRFDRTRVQISTDGTSWSTVFESHGTDGRWEQRDVNLAQFLQETGTIQVRFWFDTVDETFNEQEGWFVDDVRVVTAKLSLPGEQQRVPNLVAQPINIGFNPANPQAGESVTVHGTVINNGTADARTVTVQFVDASDEEAAVPIGPPQTIAEIPVGGSGVAQIEYDSSGEAGERKIRMVIDPNNFIPERNEADNQATRVLEVTEPPAPNLFIRADNVGFDPASPAPGDQVTIFATVLNIGTADAANVVVQFLEGSGSSARPIAPNQTIESIPAGSSAVVQVTYDTSGAESDPRIRVEVDPANFVAESKETDNDASKTMRLLSPTEPNLDISSSNVGVSPANPTDGDVVTLYATVINEGDTEVRDVQVQFLDANQRPAVPIAAQQVIPSIGPGSSGVAEIRLDTSGRAGDQKIEVQVDPHNFIAESSESDNDATITLKVAHKPTPNLLVLADNIGFSAIEPASGAPVTIYATVLNNGSAEALNVAVQFVDTTGGEPRPIGDQQMLERIGAGASAVASVEYDPTNRSGRRTIQVVADPGNFIREIDENDNEATADVTVGGAARPNLFIQASNVAFYPDEPATGDEVTVRAFVNNNGTAPAQDVSVQFVDITGGDARLLGSEQMIAEIAVGSSGTAAVTFTVPEDDRPIDNRKLQVLVDASNRIRELNEEDNSATRLLTLQSAPAANLVVMAANIGFDPISPRLGQEVTIRAVIRNDGTVDVSDVVVQLEDVSDGRPVPIGGPQTLEAIPAGGSGTVSSRYTPDGNPGEYKVRVVADPANFIPESNEIDNKATRSLQVAAAPQPNLVALADNIGFNPPGPAEGDEVLISLTVLNTGGADAEDVQVQFADVTDGGLRPIGSPLTLAQVPAGGSAIATARFDTGSKAGERRIRATIDGLSMIPETDETDNSASRNLQIAGEAAPNLTVHAENIGFVPLNPSDGDEVTIRATVRNQGSEAVSEVVVQFLDVTGDEAVPIGTSRLIDSIAPGSSGSAETVYDTSDKAGERKIRVVADRSNLILESDEEDNAAEATLTVGQPAVPNLVISSGNVGFYPNTPATGDQVTINATILNDGGADAAEVLVQFVEGSGRGTPIGEPQVIDLIPAGSSGVAQVTFDTAGKEDPRVQVIVDPNNFIVETKETDNKASATLRMADVAVPNLDVSSSNIAFTPAAPREGQKVIVTAVIVNDGTAPARDVAVQFMDASERPSVPIGGPQTISMIPAGGSAAVRVIYNTTDKTGERRIEVVADPGNFIPERSESDNSAQEEVEVLPPVAPNLVVQARNVGFNPPAPTEGDRVLVNAVILNDGAEAATDVVVQFLDVSEAEARPIGQPQIIAHLPAGSSDSVQIAYNTQDKPGDRRIRVVVDPNNFVRESNKEDNQAVVSLAVAPAIAPNLAMLSGNVKFDPPAPEINDEVTVSATVLNDGTGDAHDVLVQVLDVTGGESVPVGTEQLIDVIPTGASGTVQVKYTATDEVGSRQLRVVVDPNDTIEELNERDNRATRTLTISPPQLPDVTVSEGDIEFDPASPVEGTQTVISATITNQGIAAAEGVVVRFIDVTSRVPAPINGPQRIERLGVNEKAVVSVTYDTRGKAGERKIRVSVDPQDIVEELDETNNQAEKTLRIRSESEPPTEGPNLVVLASDIDFEPSRPEPGDPVTITVSVRNRGSEDVSDVLVRFEDNTDDAGELIGDVTITETITAGGRASAQIVFDTTDLEGDRTIRVTADPDDAISETDETDNQAERTLQLEASEAVQPPAEEEGAVASASPPDLAANLAVTAQQVQVDVVQSADAADLVIVAATVQNRGRADVGNFSVHVFDVTDDFRPVGAPQEVETLAAGSETTVRTAFQAPGGVGTRTLQVVVDADNAVAESSEEDNRASVLVSDLVQEQSGE